MATVSGGAQPFVGEARSLRRRLHRHISPRSSLSSRSSESSVNAKPPSRRQLKFEYDAPKRIQSNRKDGGKGGREILDRSEVAPRGVRDYVKLSRELVKSGGGPVRWFSPIECDQCAEGSPLLLFLPGLFLISSCFFFSASNNMIIKYGGMGRAVGA
jgi:hypothetical protein